MFDSITEDKKESFECPQCGGNVTELNGTFQCDECDFVRSKYSEPHQFDMLEGGA